MGKRIKPVSRIVKIETEIRKMAGEVFISKREVVGLDESWVPVVDISEKSEEIIVKVEIPGVNDKDITILLHSTRVEIKGIKREKKIMEKVKYLRLEREYGTFRRILFLPGAVIPEKAQASLENGILTLVLKKARRRKPEKIVLKIQETEDKNGGK